MSTAAEHAILLYARAARDHSINLLPLGIINSRKLVMNTPNLVPSYSSMETIEDDQGVRRFIVRGILSPKT